MTGWRGPALVKAHGHRRHTAAAARKPIPLCMVRRRDRMELLLGVIVALLVAPDVAARLASAADSLGAPTASTSSIGISSSGGGSRAERSVSNVGSVSTSVLELPTETAPIQAPSESSSVSSSDTVIVPDSMIPTPPPPSPSPTPPPSNNSGSSGFRIRHIKYFFFALLIFPLTFLGYTAVRMYKHYQLRKMVVAYSVTPTGLNPSGEGHAAVDDVEMGRVLGDGAWIMAASGGTSTGGGAFGSPGEGGATSGQVGSPGNELPVGDNTAYVGGEFDPIGRVVAIQKKKRLRRRQTTHGDGQTADAGFSAHPDGADSGATPYQAGSANRQDGSSPGKDDSGVLAPFEMMSVDSQDESEPELFATTLWGAQSLVGNDGTRGRIGKTYGSNGNMMLRSTAEGVGYSVSQPPEVAKATTRVVLQQLASYSQSVSGTSLAAAEAGERVGGTELNSAGIGKAPSDQSKGLGASVSPSAASEVRHRDPTVGTSRVVARKGLNRVESRHFQDILDAANAPTVLDATFHEKEPTVVTVQAPPAPHAYTSEVKAKGALSETSEDEEEYEEDEEYDEEEDDEDN